MDVFWKSLVLLPASLLQHFMQTTGLNTVNRAGSDRGFAL